MNLIGDKTQMIHAWPFRFHEWRSSKTSF